MKNQNKPLKCAKTSGPRFRKNGDTLELCIPLEDKHCVIVEEIHAAFQDEKWLATLLSNDFLVSLEQYPDTGDEATWLLVTECASSREEGLRAVEHFHRIGWFTDRDIEKWNRYNPEWRSPLTEREKDISDLEKMIAERCPQKHIDDRREYNEIMERSRREMKQALSAASNG